jgi:hypothetical protein
MDIYIDTIYTINHTTRTLSSGHNDTGRRESDYLYTFIKSMLSQTKLVRKDELSDFLKTNLWAFLRFLAIEMLRVS